MVLDRDSTWQRINSSTIQESQGVHSAEEDDESDEKKKKKMQMKMQMTMQMKKQMKMKTREMIENDWNVCNAATSVYKLERRSNVYQEKLANHLNF